MDANTLETVLRNHANFIESGGKYGVRADLGNADLRGANLRNANLREADLYKADLRGADLYKADLSRANLREADLGGANLREADLGGANLYAAYLYKADLSRANLREANLCRAVLYKADLREANLYGADLCRADLREADLYGADLCKTNLGGADLCGADLRGTDLRNANLYGADLYAADLREANLYGADLYKANLDAAYLGNIIGVPPIHCPEKGSFTGFKAGHVKNPINGLNRKVIIELRIEETALRSSATSNKCRCSKATVISITDINNPAKEYKKAFSLRDPNFRYAVGQTVEVSDFDTNRWEECSTGIHFFLTKQEAIEYNF